MKFLADQDVYFATVRLLRSLRHEVLTASQAQMAEAADLELLEAAHRQHRILLTRDRDYGEQVFVKSLAAGVIYLRM